MNKYKNKKFSLIAFCCFNIKNKNAVDSFIMFYIYTIIYSKLVLNLNEFLSSAEHKYYFEERGKPNRCWSSVTSIVFFYSIKVNVDQQLFGFPRSSKYLILCSAQEMNTGLG